MLQRVLKFLMRFLILAVMSLVSAVPLLAVLQTSVVPDDTELEIPIPDDSFLTVHSFSGIEARAYVDGILFLRGWPYRPGSDDHPLPKDPLPVFLAGPLTLIVDGKSNGAIITYEISPKVATGGESTVSSSPLILPALEGSYTIIMEGSSDLQSWSIVAPGSFDFNSSNRFFRLRMIKD